MLSILSLLSFVVIAACSNVTIEFELGTQSWMDTNDMMASVYFIIVDCPVIYKGRFKL